MFLPPASWGIGEVQGGDFPMKIDGVGPVPAFPWRAGSSITTNALSTASQYLAMHQISHGYCFMFREDVGAGLGANFRRQPAGS